MPDDPVKFHQVTREEDRLHAVGGATFLKLLVEELSNFHRAALVHLAVFQNLLGDAAFVLAVLRIQGFHGEQEQFANEQAEFLKALVMLLVKLHLLAYFCTRHQDDFLDVVRDALNVVAGGNEVLKLDRVAARQLAFGDHDEVRVERVLDVIDGALLRAHLIERQVAAIMDARQCGAQHAEADARLALHFERGEGDGAFRAVHESRIKVRLFLRLPLAGKYPRGKAREGWGEGKKQQSIDKLDAG